MFQTFFTRRALKGESGTQRALQGHSGTQRAFGDSGTQGTWALRHLSTQVLRHSGTKALGYLGTRGTRETHQAPCNPPFISG